MPRRNRNVRAPRHSTSVSGLQYLARRRPAPPPEKPRTGPNGQPLCTGCGRELPRGWKHPHHAACYAAGEGKGIWGSNHKGSDEGTTARAAVATHMEIFTQEDS